jgi:HD-GYP domain-containing protein (c-di-GMP phosphodiesterase class II)
VADTYDAILSDRPYRAASDHAGAVRELLRNSGRQFDKEIVDAFVISCEKCGGLFSHDGIAENLTMN